MFSFKKDEWTRSAGDDFLCSPVFYSDNSQEAVLYCHYEAEEHPQRALVVYRVLLSIKHLERKWINDVHVFLKRRKPCYEWNHGCSLMSDWMDKSLISKDSVVISQVALVSVLPYSRERSLWQARVVCIVFWILNDTSTHTGTCIHVSSVKSNTVVNLPIVGGWNLSSANGRLWRCQYQSFSRQYTVLCLSRMLR